MTDIVNELEKKNLESITKEKKWINEQKTFELFGYISNQLSKKSNKRVISTCSKCLCDREITFSAYRIVCKKCDSGKRMKLLNSIRCRVGNKNPFYGKSHSKKTIKRLSDIRKKNPTHKGIPASHGKHIDYIRKDGIIVKLRSSWEEKVAKYLDSNNFNWEYEKLTLPINYNYLGEKKCGTITTDFFIKDKNEIWEVKGWWRDDAKEKYEASLIQYPQYSFKLLDKAELKRMKIL